MEYPEWLVRFSDAYLALSLICAFVILVDILARGHEQAMWIMDVVWPVTALWSGPLGVLAYWRWGRPGDRATVEAARARGEAPPAARQPFPVLTAPKMRCPSTDRGTASASSSATRSPTVQPLPQCVAAFAMFFGFASSYPVNWFLLRRGIKERM